MNDTKTGETMQDDYNDIGVVPDKYEHLLGNHFR